MAENSTAGYLIDDLEIAQALDALARRDPEIALKAGSVWRTITVDGRLPVLFQERLQAFLWHEVPEGLVRGWPADTVDPPELAAASGTLFDELGWDRYADICRSATTREVHAAFERSNRSGHAAADRAEDRSGVQPPHLDDFTFSYLMGTDEYSTRMLVSRSLEHAVVTGQLVVGRTGWRSQQRAITAEVLDTPLPNRLGQTGRSIITTERLERWIDATRRRSPRLGDLRARYADRLLQPHDPPADITDRLGPLLWLLEVTDQPAPPETYPDDPVIRSLAVECHHRQWWGPTTEPPTDLGDGDVPSVSFLLGLAGITGAIARRRVREVLTPAGRRMLADPQLAWHAVITHLGGRDQFGQAVAGTAALLLLDQPKMSLAAADLWDQTADIAVELGWQRLAERHDDRTPQERLLGIGWWIFHATKLGLLIIDDIPGPYLHVAPDCPVTVTPTGQTALLAYIRHLATGPVMETLPFPTT